MNWKDTQQHQFINGLARTLDIGGTYKKSASKYTSFSADKKALKSDWKNVGHALNKAINKN